jgi:excinuclease ABC subunit C
MRDPRTATPSEVDSVPDNPAVFLLWAESGAPYLAKSALLRRRLKRLLADRDRISRIPNLRGVIERIEYWRTGSQLESAILHLELAKRHFPDDWPRLTRLKPPVLLRLTTGNPFPRTMITTRLGRGLCYGPFTNRAAAERFEGVFLDLFQIRRCEENLIPSPGHPGCVYGEMNKCMRPCQQAVSIEEYASEAARAGQFLRTNGASLADSAEAARDRASAALDFEEAERLHERCSKIAQARFAAGDLARELTSLNGVAVAPSAEEGAVDIWLMVGGRWAECKTVALSDTQGAGHSMDHRIRDLMGNLRREGAADPEHLAILLRWHGSTWRDGEWLPLDSLEKIPYRKIVNAIARVAAAHR